MPGRTVTEPFCGRHQGGILTAQQNHTYFAAFDLVTDRAGDVAQLLRAWTERRARLTAGQTAAPLGRRRTAAADTGEALGLAAARLTVTFGFGPGLFSRDGQDRFGLRAQRPEALVDLPVFNGDQLEEARTGGDLSVQACADDPQVAFHAVRQLARLAGGVARLRWTQTGFNANAAAEDTPRNLMGFKDGTQNPIAARPRERVGGRTQPNPVRPTTWSGSATRPGLDAGRQLPGGPPHPHGAGALGQHRRGVPGADHRPARNTPARRWPARRVRRRWTSTRPMPTATR